MGTRQVADALGYSRQYVIKLAQERRIRAVKTGAGWLYDPESVEDFARGRESSGRRGPGFRVERYRPELRDAAS